MDPSHTLYLPAHPPEIEPPLHRMTPGIYIFSPHFPQHSLPATGTVPAPFITLPGSEAPSRPATGCSTHFRERLSHFMANISETTVQDVSGAFALITAQLEGYGRHLRTLIRMTSPLASPLLRPAAVASITPNASRSERPCPPNTIITITWPAWKAAWVDERLFQEHRAHRLPKGGGRWSCRCFHYCCCYHEIKIKQ